MAKKIVYIVGDLSYPNGMSRVLSQKVNFLARNTGWELYVVLTEGAGKPHYYELDARVSTINFGLEFDSLYRLPLWRRLPLFAARQRRYRRLLTEYLMSVRPDITVSVLRREINFINDIGDGSRKVGEIHFNRTTYRTFSSKWLPAWLCRAVTRRWKGALDRQVRRLSRFVVLTKEDLAAWQGFSNVRVIPNPIHSWPFLPSPCTERQVVAVGRYTWQKGFDLLIEAWQRVKESPAAGGWRLAIYGAGDPAEFRRLARQAGLEGSISCNEATSDVYARYRESSLFVLSSRYEGLPLVLLEAMSAGLPAVAFACPCGPRDVITDGSDGLLVASGDTGALAEALLRLMGDEELRRTMGAAARDKARNYLEEPIMKRWIELFEEL